MDRNSIIMTTFNFHSAAQKIHPHLPKTPLTELTNFDLYLKWESHQPTHSFKVRGAFNKLLNAENLAGKVITGSAGNHGQAVALAAQMLGIEAVVFVPEKTPDIKVNKMLELGATVERVKGLFGDAEAKAIRTARSENAPFISPYNDPEIIAGAGTIALEILEEKAEIKRILVPVGGGGLIAGVGLAAKSISPEIEIIGVLSEASPYLHQQFYFGHMNGIIEKPTLTDGLAGAVEPGSITIALINEAADAVIQVTEEDVAAAIITIYRETGEIVEGSGAVGLAAVLSGQVNTADKSTAAIVSGGNIDPARFQSLLNKQ